MIAVTPTLFAGTPEDLPLFLDLVWVETPAKAFYVIRQEGKSALFPEEDWPWFAADTLGLLGSTPEQIAWAIDTAPRVNE